MMKIQCVVILGLCGWLASIHAGAKPNVLLILVDDLKPTLGCYGDAHAKTPNIDALAARGMRFDRAYCNQAVCAPSRFTLMLGSHSTSSGLYGLGSNLRQLIPDAVTMPQFFARHGYRTESLGKVFHIGHGNQGDPESFSVPHFHDKVIEYLDPESTDGGQLTREEALFTNQKLGSIRSLPRGAAFESPDVADDAYADGRVANETIKRLQAAKERQEKDGTPFFIATGFVRPHLPFSAPKKYWDLYDETRLPRPVNQAFPKDAPATALKRGGEITAFKPVPENGVVGEALQRKLIHGYYASTSYADAQVGKVWAELKRLELDEKTIVVLWGDHGFHLGDLGIWTKHTNYEQANRIPIIMVAPGVTAPGSASRQPAGSVDIFPTLAELAGLPSPQGPQPMDGLSLVPVLKDSSVRVREHTYHAYPKSKLGRAIRTERYRMVEWKKEEAVEYELYDYESDPHETQNHVAELPEVMARMKAILDTYPEPVSGKGKKRMEVAPVTSPNIAKTPLDLVVDVQTKEPLAQGVVLCQGGREHGYAVHFVEGKVTFDVRVNGEVTRIQSPEVSRGRVRVLAHLNAEKIALYVNDLLIEAVDSPGLIPVQPKDGMTVGYDEQTAAGTYDAPNPFNGTVRSTQVNTGDKAIKNR
jgi:iduronate 2-sulfatase